MHGHAQGWVADRFSITVPESWFALDPQTASSTAAISRMVAAHVRDHPRLAGQGPSVMRMVRAASEHAGRCGALYCAVMIEDVRGPGLSACVTVCVRPADADRLPATNGDGGLVGHLPAAGWWRPAGPVDLPGVGLAIRTCAVERKRPAGGGPETLRLVMRTTVPVPGRDRVAVISCASPSTLYAEALHDLFDAVTATFRFVRDPRFPDPRFPERA